MLTVRQEGDKIILDLGGRRRDVLLASMNAVKLAEALERTADMAAAAPAELFRGERWSALVVSFDRKVAVRFTGPGSGDPERVPLTPAAARALAAKLRENASWAGYGMRVEAQRG